MSEHYTVDLQLTKAIGELTGEMKHVRLALSELKQDLISLHNTVAHLQVKVGTHAALFGLGGGVATYLSITAIKTMFGQ